MSADDFEPCIQALESLCARVALVRDAQLPRVGAAASPPKGAALWSSSYARLLLWPATSNDAQAIALASDEGEGWLNEVLARAEQLQGIPLDGYLVLALPSAPAIEASEEIRKAELSVRICRKHLVWPSSVQALAAGAGPWSRVADITVLGLPDVDTAAGDSLHWPEIGASAEALWCELQEKGAATVAQVDSEAPIPIRTVA
jgi:hypothetical protein